MDNIQNTMLLLSQLVAEKRAPSELLPVAQMLVQDLTEWSEDKNFIQDTWDYFSNLKQRINWTEKCEVIATGFRDIDNRIYWVAKWNIMTIAARTGWWKTTLWINMAVNMAKTTKVWFISLEMTKEEMIDKIISRVCQVKLSSLNLNRFSNIDIENMKQYWEEAKNITNNIIIATDCFFIDDIVNVMNTMADWWAEVIFVDWLWMIEADWREKKDQLRVAMRKIKQVALARNIWVVAMQQLNREADSGSMWPFMRQISDSSAIEHISSPVLMLRRSWEDKCTDVRIFKMRRLNSDLLDKFFNDKMILDARYEFSNIKLWENLSYCEFIDYSQPQYLSHNGSEEWTMPF